MFSNIFLDWFVIETIVSYFAISIVVAIALRWFYLRLSGGRLPYTLTVYQLGHPPESSDSSFAIAIAPSLVLSYT